MGCDVHKKWIALPCYILLSQSKKGVYLNSGMRHKSDKYGILFMIECDCKKYIVLKYISYQAFW